MNIVFSSVIKPIVSGDESWTHGYSTEIKLQYSQWKTAGSPRPMKTRQIQSQVKVTLTVFFDYQGIVHDGYEAKVLSSKSRAVGNCITIIPQRIQSMLCSSFRKNTTCDFFFSLSNMKMTFKSQRFQSKEDKTQCNGAPTGNF